MKVRTQAVLSLVVLCLAFSSQLFAADDAYLFIVHGIPGRDIAANIEPTLPVDVLINDDLCTERGLTFGSMVGPLRVPAGDYNIKVLQADLLVPCSGESIAEANITLKEGQNMTAVATLDEKGQPTVSTYLDDFSTVASGDARVILTNSADSPEVQVILQVVNSQQKYTYNVNPGKEVVATVPANAYTIEVESESGTVLIPPQPLTLFPVSATLVYSTGEASNGSLALVTRTVKDVL
jgi:hypothetical protein